MEAQHAAQQQLLRAGDSSHPVCFGPTSSGISDIPWQRSANNLAAQHMWSAPMKTPFAPLAQSHPISGTAANLIQPGFAPQQSLGKGCFQVPMSTLSQPLGQSSNASSTLVNLLSLSHQAMPQFSADMDRSSTGPAYSSGHDTRSSCHGMAAPPQRLLQMHGVQVQDNMPGYAQSFPQMYMMPSHAAATGLYLAGPAGGQDWRNRLSAGTGSYAHDPALAMRNLQHAAATPTPTPKPARKPIGEVLGPEVYAAVRLLMMRQQTVYVQQLFELHKLTQVQKLFMIEMQAMEGEGLMGAGSTGGLPSQPSVSDAQRSSRKVTLQAGPDGSGSRERERQDPGESVHGRDAAAVQLPSSAEPLRRGVSSSSLPSTKRGSQQQQQQAVSDTMVMREQVEQVPLSSKNLSLELLGSSAISAAEQNRLKLSGALGSAELQLQFQAQQQQHGKGQQDLELLLQKFPDFRSMEMPQPAAAAAAVPAALAQLQPLDPMFLAQVGQPTAAPTMPFASTGPQGMFFQLQREQLQHMLGSGAVQVSGDTVALVPQPQMGRSAAMHGSGAPQLPGLFSGSYLLPQPGGSMLPPAASAPPELPTLFGNGQLLHHPGGSMSAPPAAAAPQLPTLFTGGHSLQQPAKPATPPASTITPLQLPPRFAANLVLPQPGRPTTPPSAAAAAELAPKPGGNGGQAQLEKSVTPPDAPSPQLHIPISASQTLLAPSSTISEPPPLVLPPVDIQAAWFARNFASNAPRHDMSPPGKGQVVLPSAVSGSVAPRPLLAASTAGAAAGSGPGTSHVQELGAAGNAMMVHGGPGQPGQPLARWGSAAGPGALMAAAGPAAMEGASGDSASLSKKRPYDSIGPIPVAPPADIATTGFGRYQKPRHKERSKAGSNRLSAQPREHQQQQHHHAGTAPAADEGSGGDSGTESVAPNQAQPRQPPSQRCKEKSTAITAAAKPQEKPTTSGPGL